MNYVRFWDDLVKFSRISFCRDIIFCLNKPYRRINMWKPSSNKVYCSHLSWYTSTNHLTEQILVTTCNQRLPYFLRNETNVVFGMSVPYIYRSLFFLKEWFIFYQLMIFFLFFFLFLSVCDVYKYC